MAGRVDSEPPLVRRTWRVDSRRAITDMTPTGIGRRPPSLENAGTRRFGDRLDLVGCGVRYLPHQALQRVLRRTRFSAGPCCLSGAETTPRTQTLAAFLVSKNVLSTRDF